MTERVMTLTLTGFTPAGYEISLQILDVATEKLPEALAWLDKRSADVGIRPVAGKIDCNGTRTATDAELPTCPIHNCAMERHTKGKSVWYSHKVESSNGDDVWCRGK